MDTKIEALDYQPEIWTPGEFTHQAEEALSSLGITLKKGTFEDVYRITSRDTQGSSYRYNAAFFTSENRGYRFILEKDGVEIGYYSVGIKLADQGKRVGEIGMIHLAPVLRGKGLGTLIKFLGTIQLIEGGATQIESGEGDERIGHLNEKMGFFLTEETMGLLKHPRWRMEIGDSSKKSCELLSWFYQEVREVKRRGLEFNPDLVDIDNPWKVIIQDIVEERLSRLGGSFGKDKLFFGYAYAPVFLYEKSLGKDAFYLVVTLKGKKQADEIVATEEKERVPKEKQSVFRQCRPNYPMWCIESVDLKTTQEEQELVFLFTQLGQQFFDRVYQTNRIE